MSAEIFSVTSACRWIVKQKPNCFILACNGLKKSGSKVVAIHAEHTTLSLMFAFWCHAGSRWELLLVGWSVYAVQGTQFFPWEVFQWCDKEDCQGRKGQSEVKYYVNRFKKKRKEWRPCFFVRTSGYEHSFGCFRKINTAFNFKTRWNPQPGWERFFLISIVYSRFYCTSFLSLI